MAKSAMVESRSISDRDRRAVEQVDQALPHRVRFELPAHIPAGEDHATQKDRYFDAALEAVDSLADGSQCLLGWQ
jgi:hypothetical protein